MIWPKHIQRQRQLLLENNFKEWSLRLLTFETFDQSGEETWPDQQKDRQIHLENNFKVGFFRMKTFRDLTIKRECLLFIWHIPLAEACQGKYTWLDWLEAQTKGEQDEEEDFHFQGFPLKIKTKCWLRSCLKATGVSAHFPLSLRDAFPFQNRWIFGKVPNSLWPPPPHFRKVILQIF